MIRLTGSSKKGDTIKWLMVMAEIGAIQKHHTSKEDVNISYLTQDIKDVLWCLPPFSSVSEWDGFIEVFHLHELACAFGLWTG